MMGAVYAGLKSAGGYVFVTNDIPEGGLRGSAVIRVNRYCGALAVTARGNFLSRLNRLWEDVGGDPAGREGLSGEMAADMVRSFERIFREDPHYAENPLPFLLLLVGRRIGAGEGLNHVFIRNRVVNMQKKGSKKEYQTSFDIKIPVPAESLFYGNSDLVEYLYHLLPREGIDLGLMKLFACFSLAETRKMDTNIYKGVRMASLAGGGFQWVGEEEIESLSRMAMTADREFSRELAVDHPLLRKRAGKKAGGGSTERKDGA